MATHTAQRILREALHLDILPAARAGNLIPILAQPLRRTFGDIPVVRKAESRLAKPEHHPMAINPTRWPAIGLHACRYPCLGFVIEGEIDLTLGVTEEMAGRGNNKKNQLVTLSLGENSLFIIPPGVPYTDSTGSLWLRDGQEKPFRMVWLRVLPMGAILHARYLQRQKHSETSLIIVKDPQLLTLVQLILANASRLPDTREMINSCILALLLSVDYNWSTGQILNQGRKMPARFEVQSQRQDGIATESSSAALERACQYIQTHLVYDLSLQVIATRSFISVPQLKRLFRSELDTTVMKYVTQCRIDEAKLLLTDTDVVVQEVGDICGFRHRTHFSRLFAQHTGMPPREFRKRQRASAGRSGFGAKSTRRP